MKYFFIASIFSILFSLHIARPAHAQTVSFQPPVIVQKTASAYEITTTITSPSPAGIAVSGALYLKSADGSKGSWLEGLAEKTLDTTGVYADTFSAKNLTNNTEYIVVFTFKNLGITETSKDTIVQTPKATTPTGTKSLSTNDPNRYDLLAPIPGLKAVLDPVACEEAKTTNPEEICDINQFINFMLKLIIGICAVILVVRLIIAGYAYMTTDVPFVKFGAKNTFYDALIGLLIALSSYLILNTINPRLVNNSFSLQQATFSVETFEISGALGGEFGTWKPVKVRLDKDVYPAAKKASEKTGVSIPYILAIFQQETGGGRNTGRCYWTQNGVMREDSKRRDKTAFKTIMSELGQDPNTTPVSCALPNGGWGGAIGYTQFLPTTWLEFKAEGTRLLGRAPNPWKIEDALLMTAIYTKNLGALTNERDAACRYYSGQKCDPRRDPPNEFYGNQVMQKKAGFEKEIEKLKKEGKIQ